MALDALILDVDGTLVDTNLLHARAWAAALERFGLPLPVERVAPEIGKGGELLVPALVGERVEERHGDELRRAHEEAFGRLARDEGVAAFPGAAEIFTAVRERGLRSAVATAAGRGSLERMLQRAGLDLFALADAVVTADDVERAKPRPDVVTAAVEKLGLSPAQCAMVGDTPYDGLAARRAGVVGLGVLTGLHPAEDLRGAWMRALFRDVGQLRADLGAAASLASPSAVHWSRRRLEALMTSALEAGAEVGERGDLPVGAVVADGDGTVRGRGRQRVREGRDPLAHALPEALAAAAAGPDAVPSGAAGGSGWIVATSLEPCPMCLGAAMNAGVDTVVWGLDDPLRGAAERCAPLALPGALPPRLIGGVCREAARSLFAEWSARRARAADAPLARRLAARRGAAS